MPVSDSDERALLSKAPPLGAKPLSAVALRRWGLKLAASGGKRGKKRALVAVARKQP